MDIALTHPSVHNMPNNYQRMELLGDSIINTVVSEWLYINNPTESEGFISKEKSKIIKKESLAEVSEGLELIKYVSLSESVNISNPQTLNKINCDIYEAIVGAIFLDSDFNNTKEFILFSLLKNLRLEEISKNYKGRLIEYCHKNNLREPSYKVEIENGPSHNRNYEIKLVVENIVYIGKGYSIKNAEQDAARKALKLIKSS